MRCDVVKMNRRDFKYSPETFFILPFFRRGKLLKKKKQQHFGDDV